MVNCELPGVGGHKIESLVFEEAVDPSTKQVFREYKLLCIKCGKSLEELKVPAKQTRGPRKNKLAAVPPQEPASDQSASPVSATTLD